MKYICTLLVLISFQVFGHGENRPGPHGGHIRMPGAYHTELVLDEKMIKIYLLDMSFRNPITEDSSISLRHSESDSDLPCQKQGDFFSCELTPHQLSQGTLRIKTQRKGVKGREVAYPLPLAFKSAPKSMDHSHHNHH